MLPFNIIGELSRTLALAVLPFAAAFLAARVLRGRHEREVVDAGAGVRRDRLEQRLPVAEHPLDGGLVQALAEIRGKHHLVEIDPGSHRAERAVGLGGRARRGVESVHCIGIHP